MYQLYDMAPKTVNQTIDYGMGCPKSLGTVNKILFQA